MMSRRRWRSGVAAWLLTLLIMSVVGGSSALADPPSAAVVAHPRDDAHVVAQQQVGARLVDLSIWSPALGRAATVRC